mmetsp:Transcript_99581/g.171479  ORF Transcript_99581/g.171479 Transcript_99581/m.171479 type:complete len:84 (+) Transcript_99581:1304-1555(+)
MIGLTVPTQNDNSPKSLQALSNLGGWARAAFQKLRTKMVQFPSVLMIYELHEATLSSPHVEPINRVKTSTRAITLGFRPLESV